MLPLCECWIMLNDRKGQNSSVGSVLGSLSCFMQRREFDFPLRKIFPVEGFFPWSKHGFWLPFSQNSFGWEYKPRSSLCTHAFHNTESKDPDNHVLAWWNASNKNTPSMHHPWRWNVTISMVGLKNGHIRKNLSQNDEPQRYSWGMQKMKKKKRWQAEALISKMTHGVLLSLFALVYKDPTHVQVIFN